ncbi:CPBP family intramembrane metalloprotease [Streptomyces sp. AJS327]|nr:CPBP family intramembrane metalloprotease [Streptomyces sp. AJS327]
MSLAFGLSWASWCTAIALGGDATAGPTALPFLFGAFGPLLAALAVRVRRTRRGEPVPHTVVRTGRRTLLWAPLLLALTSATVLVAVLLAQAAGDGGPSTDTARDLMRDAGGPVAFVIGMVVSGPLSEEPGWRGTAYPRMRVTMSRFQVSAVLGVIWAVWHLPLFYIDGTVQNDLGLASPNGVLFSASAIPMTMLVSYAYERAGVIASIATHFAANTTMVVLSVDTPVTLALITGVQALVAVLLLATARPAHSPAITPAATPHSPAAPASQPLGTPHA